MGGPGQILLDPCFLIGEMGGWDGLFSQALSSLTIQDLEVPTHLLSCQVEG